jgi:hypothetical protein
MVINALLRISPTLSNFFQNKGSSLSDNIRVRFRVWLRSIL